MFQFRKMPLQILFLILVSRWILPGLLGRRYHSLRFRDEAAENQRGKVIYLGWHSKRPRQDSTSPSDNYTTDLLPVPAEGGGWNVGPRRPFQAQETLDAVTVPSGNSVLTYSQGCLSQPFCWFPRCSIRLCAGPAQFSAGGSRSPPPLNCFLVLPSQCLPNLMLDFLPQPWRKDSSVVWVLVLCPSSGCLSIP